MIFHSFYEYWKQFGQFNNEVINSPTELEETLKSLSAKIWQDAEGWQQLPDNLKYLKKVKIFSLFS